MYIIMYIECTAFVILGLDLTFKDVRRMSNLGDDESESQVKLTLKAMEFKTNFEVYIGGAFTEIPDLRWFKFEHNIPHDFWV